MVESIISEKSFQELTGVSYKEMCRKLIAMEGIELCLIKRENVREGVVFRPYLDDMAVTYRMLISDNGEQQTYMRIMEADLQKYNIDRDVLHRRAFRGYSMHHTFKRKGIMEKLLECNPEYGEEIPPSVLDAWLQEEIAGDGLYIVETGTALYYPNRLQKIAEELGSDLYVFPSSVHEILLTKVKGDCDPTIVLEANAHVAPNVQLSDHIYIITQNGELKTYA